MTEMNVANQVITISLEMCDRHMVCDTSWVLFSEYISSFKSETNKKLSLFKYESNFYEN